MHFKAIIFDFDGTLVVSNQIKIDTYFKIFKKFNIDINLIKNILKEHPELNRYDTIIKIVEKANKNLDVPLLFEDYSNEVQRKIYNADSLKYAVALLEYLCNHGVKVFLSSNTPEIFLKDLIRKRDWNKYFLSIFGYPNKKVDTVKKIIQKYNLSLGDVIVIGDGKSDKETAIFNGISFIRVNSMSLLPVIRKLKIPYSINSGKIQFLD